MYPNTLCKPSEALVAKLKQFVFANPSDAAVWFHLGELQISLGNNFSARSSLEQAIKLRPTYAEALLGLGNVLDRISDYNGSAEAFMAAATLAPGFIEAEQRLETLCRSRGLPRAPIKNWPLPRPSYQYSPAPELMPGTDPVAQEIKLRALLEFEPENANILAQLGLMLLAQHRIVEAELFVRHVLIAIPSHLEASIARGSILLAQSKKAEALEHALDLSSRAPLSALAAVIAMQSSIELCYWPDFEQRMTRTRDLVTQHIQAVDPLECSLLGFSAEEIVRCAQVRRTPQSFELTPRTRPLHAHHDKIVVGYMSADFQEHPVGRIVAQLLPHHDRSRFRINGYSLWLDDTETRKKIVDQCDEFTELHGMTAEAGADRIASDGVDVLIDLTGYTLHHRTDILALRPAPVQVNYLGYPGTMGVHFIDYLIADHTIATEPTALMATEKIIRLPESFMLGARYASERTEPKPSRSDFGLPENGVVFCNFAAANRLMPEVFRLWLRIMQVVPGSLLWLGERHPDAQRRLRAYAAEHRIRPDRVIFSDRVSDELYLARYRVADLFLDTLPFNAHSTAIDSLWMGCPVITCLGTTFAGRVAGSVVRAAGLPQLVTQSLTEYEVIAVKLGNHPAELADLRSKLLQGRSSHPLFNGPRYVRYLEQAYSTMYKRWQGGGTPEGFDISL